MACKVAAIVLVILAIAIVLYLRAVIPADYVWPGISKVAVACVPVGLLGAALGLMVLSDDYQRR